MSELTERYETTADGFTECVRAVPDDAWDAPAPCEGWVARDVVRHLAEWVPGFLGASYDLDLGGGPSPDEDPVAAWLALDRSLREALRDPAIAMTVRETPVGAQPFEQAVDMLVTTDVLVHTWDLGRAAGQPVALDANECRRVLEGMEPIDEVLRQSGHFGPRVAVADDADPQTRLIAFLGRDPGFTPAT